MENNKKLSEIDYGPLDDLDHLSKIFLRKRIVVVFVLTIVAIFLLFFSGFLTIIILIVVSSFLTNEYFNKKSEIWLRFANVNGWRTDLTTITDSTYIPPSLYGEGTQRKISPVIHADFEGHNCDLYFYEHQISENGKNRTIYYTVARVELDKQLPHIILDSVNSRSLDRAGDATELITLEGDFSDYYNVYHKKGEQIDILSVLTPDIMYKIRNQTLKQDIEIYDKCIYFIIQADKKEPTDIKSIIHNVDAITDEIKHKVSTMNYVGLYNKQEIISPEQAQMIQLMNVIPRGIVYIFIFMITAPLILTILIFLIFLFS